MAIFKRADELPNNGNGKPALKSKWQGVIDELNVAHAAMNRAMDLMSRINFDLQKGADFILHCRDTLVKAVEDAGGAVEQTSVEEQIREFIPKTYRPPERAVDEPQ